VDSSSEFSTMGGSKINENLEICELEKDDFDDEEGIE
jgi:hypothetical protein